MYNYKYNLPAYAITENTQEQRVLATNQLVFARVFKTNTFRLIHSIVTLGDPDYHFRDGFQMKQAVSWPISLVQNTAA